MEQMSDEAMDRFLTENADAIFGLADAESEIDAPEIPVPDELRARVMGKAVQLSGMVAAGEARSQGVEINGWEPSPDGDREHYHMTRPELLEFLGLDK
ncbi:hypothetical protein KW794_00460 [Candidatus Saccharibacteria bacterium]|nr:hypothetical protein [Candidatus Saccharibacteria bacterium]